MDLIAIHASFAFFGLGIGELALIFLILLLIFGGSKLPKVGEALGTGIRNFKTGLSKASEEDEALDITPAGELADDAGAAASAAVKDVAAEEVKPS